MLILAILGTAFYVIGALISLVYSIIILIQAFKTSVVWGLVSLLVPFGILVFIFNYWDNSKGPFLKSMIGVSIMIVGAILGLVAAGSETAAA